MLCIVINVDLLRVWTQITSLAIMWIKENVLKKIYTGGLRFNYTCQRMWMLGEYVVRWGGWGECGCGWGLHVNLGEYMWKVYKVEKNAGVWVDGVRGWRERMTCEAGREGQQGVVVGVQGVTTAPPSEGLTLSLTAAEGRSLGSVRRLRYIITFYRKTQKDLVLSSLA